jgi:periplasmic protein TonB
MQEALEPLEEEAAQQTKSTLNLALGLTVSVVLHLILSAVLLSMPQGVSSSRPSVTYVDLKSVQLPAPLTAPPTETAPEPAAEPEAPAPEESTVPVTPAAAEPVAQQAAQPQDQPAAAETGPVEADLPRTTLGIGLTKGYFQGLGTGETLRVGIKEYYLEMLDGINQKWWVDPQLNKRRATVVVNITVARNGEIVASDIMASSGDRSYDRAVLAALTAAGPLPPLPANYHGEFFEVPIRLVPPLNLLAW